MFGSIGKTLAQLSDRRLRGVLIVAMAMTLGLIVVLALVGGYVAETLAATGILWLDDIIGVLGFLAALFIALLLFPGTVQIVSGLFLDRVAEAVEARHYPDLGPPRSQSIIEIVFESVRFAVVSVALNLLVLPLYLLPGVNLVLFYVLNGYLLGREYAELVAARRMTPEQIRVFRAENKAGLFTGGVVIAAATTVPVLNLTIPVLATAFALHEHERLRQRGIQG